MQVGRKVKHNVDEASKNNLCVDWEADHLFASAEN